MVSLNWFNEKGNVSVKVRDGVRKQVDSKLQAVLNDNFENVDKIKNSYFVPVGADKKTGATIYMSISFTVTDKLPSEKAVDSKKASKTEVIVPDLFTAPDESDDEDEDEEA